MPERRRAILMPTSKRPLPCHWENAMPLSLIQQTILCSYEIGTKKSNVGMLTSCEAAQFVLNLLVLIFTFVNCFLDRKQCLILILDSHKMNGTTKLVLTFLQVPRMAKICFLFALLKPKFLPHSLNHMK
uniref:Uncharacterized protein n=1 Tax=Micrurus corallinus TaxID=54390 RepID=A0A2D4GU65_MICCO